jgi:hypothetical protein
VLATSSRRARSSIPSYGYSSTSYGFYLLSYHTMYYYGYTYSMTMYYCG